MFVVCLLAPDGFKLFSVVLSDTGESITGVRMWRLRTYTTRANKRHSFLTSIWERDFLMVNCEPEGVEIVVGVTAPKLLPVPRTSNTLNDDVLVTSHSGTLAFVKGREGRA